MRTSLDGLCQCRENGIEEECRGVVQVLQNLPHAQGMPSSRGRRATRAVLQSSASGLLLRSAEAQGSAGAARDPKQHLVREAVQQAGHQDRASSLVVSQSLPSSLQDAQARQESMAKTKHNALSDTPGGVAPREMHETGALGDRGLREAGALKRQGPWRGRGPRAQHLQHRADVKAILPDSSPLKHIPFGLGSSPQPPAHVGTDPQIRDKQGPANTEQGGSEQGQERRLHGTPPQRSKEQGTSGRRTSWIFSFFVGNAGQHGPQDGCIVGHELEAPQFHKTLFVLQYSTKETRAARTETHELRQKGQGGTRAIAACGTRNPVPECASPPK